MRSDILGRPLLAGLVLPLLGVLAFAQPAAAGSCFVFITPWGDGYCICSGGSCCISREFCACDFAPTCKCVCMMRPGGASPASNGCGGGIFGGLGIGLLNDPAPEVLRASGARDGAYVDRVLKGSPGDQAGLTQGDVIVQIGTASASSAAEANRIFGASGADVGQVKELTFLREGTPHSVRVTVVDPRSLFPRMHVPFVAKVEEERRWIQNGVPHREHKQTTIYRDSFGREASEEFTPQGDGTSRRTVDVTDPVKGVDVWIQDSDRSAVISDGSRLTGKVTNEKKKVLRLADRPTEYLGTRVIQGVVCQGYRQERVLENYASGPVTFTWERWVSDLTDVPVLEFAQDGWGGRQERRMVEIHEGLEPDAGIFEVPAGYKVEDQRSPKRLVSEARGSPGPVQ